MQKTSTVAKSFFNLKFNVVIAKQNANTSCNMPEEIVNRGQTSGCGSNCQYERTNETLVAKSDTI